MFDQFGPDARSVVVLSQESARGFRHNYVGTEHFLHVLTDQRFDTSPILTSVGVPQARVDNWIVSNIGVGQQAPVGNIPLTPRSKKALERAVRLREAGKLVEPRQILLALLGDDRESTARCVLNHFKIDETALANVLCEDDPLAATSSLDTLVASGNYEAAALACLDLADSATTRMQSSSLRNRSRVYALLNLAKTVEKSRSTTYSRQPRPTHGD